MPRLLAITFVMSVLAVAVVAIVADDAESPPISKSEVRARVESLVKQLDSQKLAERAHAERSLLEMGPEVLTYFPPPELAASASVAESLKRLRVQLERRAARESALASHVRYSGEASIAAILREVTLQTRNRVQLSGDLERLASQTMQVDFQDRPFWDCIDLICDRLKARTDFDAQQGAMILRLRTPKDPVDIAIQRSGPYRLAIQSVDVRPITGNSEFRLLRITGKVALEPRLRPLFLHFAAAEVTASRSEALRLEPWNPAATYELPAADAGREMAVQFDYLLPANDSGKPVDLRGQLSVQLAAGTERVVFDKTAQTAGAARRRGGVTVRLRGVEFEPLAEGHVRAEIKVTVSYDTGGPAFESHRTWMFHNAAYFENEAARRFDFTEYDTSLQSNGAVGVDYRWKQLAGPISRYQFVYEAPMLILDLPLEIKLDSIPVKRLATTKSP